MKLTTRHRASGESDPLTPNSWPANWYLKTISPGNSSQGRYPETVRLCGYLRNLRRRPNAAAPKANSAMLLGSGTVTIAISVLTTQLAVAAMVDI
jgi:hypothetical protein